MSTRLEMLHWILGLKNHLEMQMIFEFNPNSFGTEILNFLLLTFPGLVECVQEKEAQAFTWHSAKGKCKKDLLKKLYGIRHFYNSYKSNLFLFVNASC